MYEYQAHGVPTARDPLGVVDGDTLHVTIDLGCDIGLRTTLGLYVVNAPEMNTPQGKTAKQFVIDWLAQHCPDGAFTIHTIKDKRENTTATSRTCSPRKGSASTTIFYRRG